MLYEVLGKYLFKKFCALKPHTVAPNNPQKIRRVVGTTHVYMRKLLTFSLLSPLIYDLQLQGRVQHQTGDQSSVLFQKSGVAISKSFIYSGIRGQSLPPVAFWLSINYKQNNYRLIRCCAY